MSFYDQQSRSAAWRRGAGGSSPAGFKVSVEGLSDLETALNELPSALGKATVRRALTIAAKPVAERARSLARVVTGKLRDSVRVSSRASKSAGAAAYSMTLSEGGSKKDARLAFRAANKEAAGSKSDVEIYVGATVPYAHLVEFGTHRSRAFPFLRPAWEATKGQVLETLKPLLWAEIEKTAKRLAKRNGGGG